jgi:endoribonuclease Dicer
MPTAALLGEKADSAHLASTVPAERAIIDWQLLRDIMIDQNNVTSPCSEPHAFENKFVADVWDGSRKFFIGNVNQNYRAFDPVPDGAPVPRSRSYARVEQNIAQYSNSLTYNARQRITWDKDQPVFNAELLSLRRDFLVDQGHEDGHVTKQCYIVLQLLAVSPVSKDAAVA